MVIKVLGYIFVFFIAFYLAYVIVERLTPIKIVEGLPAKTINTFFWVFLGMVILYLIATILIYAGIPF